MVEWRRLLNSRCQTLSLGKRPAQRWMLSLLLLALFGSAIASAQTTTISGKVFDPRTTSNSLPLPNVLVYITTEPVPALPSGVQCLTYQAPTGAVSYAYTATDGTFTLANVPENASYTLVIQAGKWRRQYAQSVVATPITSLALHMPADHTQGDIPMIAIATGSVDAAECVLLDMGIAATEFTDDNGGVNGSGHIHLYRGSASSGAEINASTPSQSTLMNSSSTVNNYDMLMFPCQGTAANQASATGATNLVNFANLGGRLFTTHYSYAWLDPDAPYNSQFSPVANWTTGAEKQVASGVGTVANNFSDGATLAQWLQNSNDTVAGTSNQIDIGTLRTDVGTVIPPTQSWVTLNNGIYGSGGSQVSITNSPVMQMTFNTPVGAPAANQCGRVMYNDYHVFNVSDPNAIFPAECPNPSTHVMSAQEEMLEYALFDLSAFVQPVVVPTLSVSFNPSPVIVKQNDSGDQVTVSVTNTSATTETSSSAILTFILPQLMSATAITDSTGGWNCTASTLTCVRNSSLGAAMTDSVTLTLSVAAYPAGGLSSYAGQIVATVSSVTFSTNVTASDNVIYQQVPAITWATPAPIVYGSALGSAQLDAAANTAGTFTYNPPAGTVLTAGQHTIAVTFAPTDTTNYTSATATVTINVLAGSPTVKLTASANPAFLDSSVTFTANVGNLSNGAGGTVVFYDGSAQIGSAAMSNGSATITTSTLASGSHTITAAYSGDSNFGPATSSPVSEAIQDFTITAAAGGTATIPPAGQAIFTLYITPVGGSTLPAAVTLGHGNLPYGSTASLSPSTISAGSTTSSVVLQLNLSGSSATARQSDLGKGAWPVAFALLLVPFGFKSRKLRMWLVLAAVSTALATGMAGCGGKLASQSFSIPVTATSGSLSHSITVKLVVKNSN